jgi:hypothetical protein
LLARAVAVAPRFAALTRLPLAGFSRDIATVARPMVSPAKIPSITFPPLAILKTLGRGMSSVESQIFKDSEDCILIFISQA